MRQKPGDSRQNSGRDGAAVDLVVGRGGWVLALFGRLGRRDCTQRGLCEHVWEASRLNSLQPSLAHLQSRQKEDGLQSFRLPLLECLRTAFRLFRMCDGFGVNGRETSGTSCCGRVGLLTACLLVLVRCRRTWPSGYSKEVTSAVCLSSHTGWILVRHSAVALVYTKFNNLWPADTQ